MACISCGRGFHGECNTDPCCCSIDSDSSSISAASNQQSSETKSTESTDRDISSIPSRQDVSISAGRKRAAKQYEINPDAPCEWRGLTNCGGGFSPVTGCILGFQVDRHHGPDKTTTNNSEENVHLICKPCHNLWHRRNDPLYGELKCPEGIQLHEPRWATVDELSTKEVV